MSPEQDKQEEVHLQHEAEHTQHKEKVSVWGYLTILFAAAFLLLGLTLFMQIRNQNEANNDLTDSVNNLQSLGNLVDQNNALLEKNQDLQKQVDELEKTLSEAQAELKIQSSTSSEREQQLMAMDWLWRIQRAYSRGAGTEAKSLAQAFDASSLPASLPKVALALTDGPSPADQYAALRAAMGLETVQP